jgi:hypothetical protein
MKLFPILFFSFLYIEVQNNGVGSIKNTTSSIDGITIYPPIALHRTPPLLLPVANCCLQRGTRWGDREPPTLVSEGDRWLLLLFGDCSSRGVVRSTAMVTIAEGIGGLGASFAWAIDSRCLVIR